MRWHLPGGFGLFLLASAASAQHAYPPVFEKGQTILFQGDSITDGNRGRNQDPNHILGHGYVFSIASAFGAAYPDLGLTFINRGVSGETVEGLEARWKPDALDLKPDVVSILIGINDVNRARAAKLPFSAEKSEIAYDRLLAATLKERPGVKIILCEPFVLDVGKVAEDAAGWRKDVRAVAAVVEKLAQKYRLPVVHFQELFDEAVKRAPAEHWIWDGIHPTYSGHQLMADEWVRVYNEFYVSPLNDPARNSAIAPQVNFERDSYDWLHRHADVLDAQKKGNPEVVLIGDSITHFWGGEPKATQQNGPKSWKETFGDRKVLNMGFGWDRTQNVLWRLQHGEFEGLSPKAIVLNIGTNNLVGDSTARTNTPEEVAEGILRIVEILKQRSPTSKIVVMAVFPRGFEKGNALDQSITRLNEIVGARLSGVTYLALGMDLREFDGSISPKTFSDGTHPTEKGYAIWGRALRLLFGW